MVPIFCVQGRHPCHRATQHATRPPACVCTRARPRKSMSLSFSFIQRMLINVHISAIMCVPRAEIQCAIARSCPHSCVYPPKPFLCKRVLIRKCYFHRNTVCECFLYTCAYPRNPFCARDHVHKCSFTQKSRALCLSVCAYVCAREQKKRMSFT
jgi:hypothetical protein